MLNSSTKVIVLFFSSYFLCNSLWGHGVTDTQSIIEEVLAESVPSLFSPGNLSIRDFNFEWVRNPINGVKVELVEGSLEWVRVRGVLTLPKARVTINVGAVESGEIFNAGFSQPFQQTGLATIPLALISGEKNPILITIVRNGTIIHGELRLKYQPQQPGNTKIFIDPSCFNFNLTANPSSTGTDSWMYIGCKMLRAKEEKGIHPSLEIYIFWDQVGQTIRIANIDTPANSNFIWPLRLNPEPGNITLVGGEREVLLTYQTAKILHSTSFSLGLGPYLNTFAINDNAVSSVNPLITLYWAYFLNDTTRLVGFGAGVIGPHYFTDLGLYLYLESSRFLDNRMTLNLLIGGHTSSFEAFGNVYMKPSFPQGVEFSVSNVFSPRKSLKLGGFFYPPLGSKSYYYNSWLRWGGSTFVELNYISWGATQGANVFTASSLGISVGFPLGQFW